MAERLEFDDIHCSMLPLHLLIFWLPPFCSVFVMLSLALSLPPCHCSFTYRFVCFHTRMTNKKGMFSLFREVCSECHVFQK